MTKDAICTRILELELEILRLREMMEDLENRGSGYRSKKDDRLHVVEGPSV